MPAAYADLTALANTLSLAGGEKINYAMAGLIREAAYEVQRDSQQKAPKKTGTLASSITVTFHGPLTAIIGPSVNYGVFQEFGTSGPYEIRPKRPGGVLVFQAGGKTVFARKVLHPGVKAQPFMRPAAQDVVGGLTSKIAGVGVNLIVDQ